MRRTLLTLMTVLSVYTICAQTGRLFNTDNGLSSSFVGHIYQDRDGFIWISTRNGLNRYDGYNFKVFKKGQPGCEGMRSNYINYTVESRDNILYIGTQRGVQTYSNDRFEDVKLIDDEGSNVISFVNCIAELDDGTILISTSSNGIFASKGNHVAHPWEKTRGFGKGARKLFQSSDRTVWVLTESVGIMAINGNSKRNYFTSPELKMTALDICEDKYGNIYVATYSKGLWVKSKKDLDFRHIDALGDLHVQSLYVRRDGNIMLGLDGHGCAIYHPQNGSVAWNPYHSHEINLQHAKVFAFTEDNAGNIWMAMLQKGVYVQQQKTAEFGYMGVKLGNKNTIGDCCVTSTLIDSKGRSWVGTDKDGLYVLDQNHNLITHVEGTPQTILSIREDKEGRIWTGSYVSGIGYIDPVSYKYNKVELGVAPRLSAFDIAIDSHDNMWIASMGDGVIKYNHNSKLLKVYKANQSATSDRKVNGLINNYVNQVALSENSQMLIVATTMGLCCLDISKDSWVSAWGKNALNYGLNIRTTMASNGKYVWYGTDDGLYRYDVATGKTLLLTEKDGLPDRGIASISRDKDGSLWVATDHGLCTINEQAGKIMECYYVDDGLQSNEFSDRAASVGPNGTILLGGTGGITWFYPRNITTPKWQAKVKLTNFIVSSMPVVSGNKSGSYTITKKPVMESNNFDLSPDDNTFTMQLSTLTYDAPEHIAYAYSMNGEEWTVMQPGQNEINFSHVATGIYKLRVKALKNGQESEINQFTIHIHAPWYKSPIAYLLYILLAIAASTWYVIYRRRKENDRMELQEHIHAEEMSEAKVKFFMNISHEIRTPMTLIVAPLVSLLKEDHDPKRTGAYITIKRNAERILHLINQLMDLRKVEKGMMKMHMRETDLIGFIEDICNMFEYQAKAKKIKFKFHHTDETLPVWIDLTNFDKVIVNLLSNSFKFTPLSGHVDISVRHDGKYVTIDVKDDGEGIPKDRIDKIFERFYQSETRTNDRYIGTGIGLDLTNSLVLLHHGTITASNNEDGPGSTFSVTIPLGNSHLRPDEIAAETLNEEPQDQITTLLKESYEYDKENAKDTQSVDQQPAKGGKPHLVIVEDDIDILQYLTQELRENFRITSYGNGQDALTGILKDVPDIVLSDIMMPLMDGNTLCAKLKNNIRTNTVPIVLLSAKSSDEEKLEGLETGADAYIVKPFNLDILRRTLINLLESRNVMRNKIDGSESQDNKVENLDMQTADDKLMEKVMKVINANMNNADLSIDAIAKEVGLSRVHFYRKMKTLTNQSPHNFLRNIRIKQAARLFDDGHQNVNEVMYAVGYNNASSFSVAFKAVYGVSPREYIKLKY